MKSFRVLGIQVRSEAFRFDTPLSKVSQEGEQHYESHASDCYPCKDSLVSAAKL